MDRDSKLVAILRRQYHITLTAGWEKIYSVLGGVAQSKIENTLPEIRVILRHEYRMSIKRNEQKKWRPDVVTKCMGFKIKYQFLAVQINSILCADLSLINNMQVHYEAKAFLPFLYLFVQPNSVKIT